MSAHLGSWRGSDGDAPRLGRRGLLWFRRRIRAFALSALESLGTKKDDEQAALLAHLVEWYTARADEFVRWHDYEEYRGPGYSCGYWTLATKAAAYRLVDAWDEWRRDAGLPPFLTSSAAATGRPPRAQPIPPGPIDVDAALATLQTTPAHIPVERHAMSVLAQGNGNDHKWWPQKRRLERWGYCSQCGAKFERPGRPSRRVPERIVRDGRVKRCVACRTTRRTATTSTQRRRPNR